MTTTQRHPWDMNPAPLDAADTFDDMIHIPGVGNNPFPGPRTLTETRLNQELNAAYAEIAALKQAVKNLTVHKDFWYQKYRKTADKLYGGETK